MFLDKYFWLVINLFSDEVFHLYLVSFYLGIGYTDQIHMFQYIHTKSQHTMTS